VVEVVTPNTEVRAQVVQVVVVTGYQVQALQVHLVKVTPVEMIQSDSLLAVVEVRVQWVQTQPQALLATVVLV
jgi:hypothetical protein